MPQPPSGTSLISTVTSGRALGGKQVLLEEVTDRELLGGFVAEVGSLLVDASLDGQLARMHRRIAQG